LPDESITGGNMQGEQLRVQPLKREGRNGYMAVQNNQGNNSMLSQVVGVIIGSPEYQRR
jgi:hypothetical protein